MSGYAFRLRILHERGLSLLNRQNRSNQQKHISSVDKELFTRGQHSSMINGLQGCYPIYGSVIRLAKRWVASHLFSFCLVEVAVELLVAYLFLKPLPFYVPCSRISGFLRFLRLLSENDWNCSALVVLTNYWQGSFEWLQTSEQVVNKVLEQCAAIMWVQPIAGSSKLYGVRMKRSGGGFSIVVPCE